MKFSCSVKRTAVQFTTGKVSRRHPANPLNPLSLEARLQPRVLHRYVEAILSFQIWANNNNCKLGAQAKDYITGEHWRLTFLHGRRYAATFLSLA